jgi:hypothetical protein
LIIINYAAFSGRLILSRKTDTIKHLTFPIASGVHGICLIVTTLPKCKHVLACKCSTSHFKRNVATVGIERRAGLGFYIKITINKTSHN